MLREWLHIHSIEPVFNSELEVGSELERSRTDSDFGVLLLLLLLERARVAR